MLHQSGSTTLDGASYAVDNAGNRTSRTPQPSGTASNYGYDALYELTSVTQSSTTTESYTYDPVGNRLSSLGVSPYSNNSSNELTSTPSTTYTYDSDGNTQTEVNRPARREEPKTAIFHRRCSNPHRCYSQGKTTDVFCALRRCWIAIW